MRPVIVREEPSPESYVGGLAIVGARVDARRRAIVHIGVGVGVVVGVLAIVADALLGWWLQ